jgi:hypothetical protein
MVTCAMTLRYAGTSKKGTCGLTVGEHYNIYEKALQNPEILTGLVEYPHLTQPLYLFAAASEAYRVKTGQEMPLTYRPLPEITGEPTDAPTGEPWQEASVGEKYPKRYAKFGDCKYMDAIE